MRHWVRNVRQQKGAASLEMLFALPILFLLLVTGLMIGYYQFTRLALIWHVFSRSEELATRTEITSVIDTGANWAETPAGLTGAAQAFSFSVPIPNHGFSASVACHPAPLRFPNFRLSAGAAPAEDETDSGLFAEMTRLLRSAQRFIEDDVGDVVDVAEDITDDALLARQLITEIDSNRSETKDQAIRLISGWGAETGVAFLCKKDGAVVASAKAVAWREKTKGLK